MLVLHVVPPALGGMRRHVLSLLNRLDGERYQTAVVFAAYPMRRPAADLAFPASTLDDSAGRKPTVNLLAPWQLRHLVLKLRPDLIHCHGSKAAFVTRLALRGPGGVARVPVVYTVHGASAPNSLWLQRLVRAAERRLAPATAAYVAVSHAVAAAVAADWGVPADRLNIIPNGIDAARFHNLPRKALARRFLGLAPARPVVGMAGRMAWEKGPDLFLRAARLVADRKPGCQFLVAGDGPVLGEARRLARSLGLEAAVTFTGHLPDVRNALAAMDIYVLPSRSEAISLGLLEAMAAARPVVAFGVGGVPEAVTHWRTGLLAPPGDVSGLAASVCRLLEDEVYRRRLAAAARQRVQREFDLGAMVGRVAVLYDRLAAGETGDAGGGERSMDFSRGC